jgi:hypothetical protein
MTCSGPGLLTELAFLTADEHKGEQLSHLRRMLDVAAGRAFALQKAIGRPAWLYAKPAGP